VPPSRGHTVTHRAQPHAGPARHGRVEIASGGERRKMKERGKEERKSHDKKRRRKRKETGKKKRKEKGKRKIKSEREKKK
jgi:hypothetical protein